MALPGVGRDPVLVISAEDTILAKLRWYRDGGQVSERPWRDIAGILAASGQQFDRAYLEQWAGAGGRPAKELRILAREINLLV